MELKKITFNRKRKIFSFNCFCGKSIEAHAFSVHSIVSCPICRTEFMISKNGGYLRAQEMEFYR